MNNRSTLQSFFLFGFFLLLFILIVRMLSPFFSVILWTVLLYILIKPLHQKCEKKLNSEKRFYKLKKQILAAVFAVGTLVVIVGALSFLCTLLVKQGIEFLGRVELFILGNPDFLDSGFIAEKLREFSEQSRIDFSAFDFDSLEKDILQSVRSFSTKLISIGTTLVGKTGNFIVSIVFVVFALFFCFLDGDYLIRLFKVAIPLNSKHINVLTKKFSEITKNLFSGYILVALYQGLAAFIIFSCFGVQSSLLLSVFLMICTFVPIFGAALVWLPIGLFICVTDSVVKGIIFLIVAGFCISFLDNFLRPLFLKDRINLHPLVIFFSILGGIQLFGINGLILGPLTIIIFFTVLNLIVDSKENNSVIENHSSDTEEVSENDGVSDSHDENCDGNNAIQKD